MVRLLRGWRPGRSGLGRPHAAVLVVALGLLAIVPGPTASGAADRDPADAAVRYLLDHQGADGGFGAGAATPEAVSAIAQQAQTSSTWSTKDAVDAVGAADAADGSTPLDALDALAEDDPSPELAAQIVSRAVVAMGLDPENFDPGGDANPVDLVRVVRTGRASNGSYGSLAATAEAVLALVLVGRPVSDTTVAFLGDAQQRNGGWSADGEPHGSAVDVATTALVVEALVAAGASAEGDGAVHRALGMLARTQSNRGAWPVERGGAADATATAWAMGAIRAGGFDPGDKCWRDTVDPAQAGSVYTAPATSIATAQAADGHIAGSGDGIESTAVGVQGLLGRWLPTVRAPQSACAADDGGTGINLALLFLAAFAVFVVVGAVAIMRRGGR